MNSFIIIKSAKGTRLLAALLAQCQRRARVRMLTAEDLQRYSDQLEHKLSSVGLPKRARIGCRARLTPRLMPRGYRFPAASTVAIFIRRPSGWAASVERATYWPVPRGCARFLEIEFGPAAKEILARKATQPVHIAPAPPADGQLHLPGLA